MSTEQAWQRFERARSEWHKAIGTAGVNLKREQMTQALARALVAESKEGAQEGEG